MSNVAKNNRFIFRLSGFKELTYQVQTASLGSLNLGGSAFPTQDADLFVPSNKVDFSPLAIRVLLTENFQEWMDAVKWTYGMTKTNSSHLDNVSIGTLLVLNANNVPIMEVTYNACAPISTSEIDFDLTSDEQVATFDLSMTYDSMDIRNMITGETIVYSE